MRILYAVLLALSLLYTDSWATNYCNDANIIGCYPAQEDTGTTLVDHSSNNYNGIFATSGHPVWQTSAPSRTYLTYSLNLSGSNDYIYLGNINAFLAPGQAQSIVFWLYLTGSGSYPIDVQIPGKTLFEVETSTNVTLGSWTWVGITWDGSNTATNMHIYLNGTEASYAIQTNGSVLASQNFSKISYKPWGDGNLGGNLTEIAYFSRVLSGGDITSIYNNGLLQAPIPTPPNTTILKNAYLNGAIIQ